MYSMFLSNCQTRQSSQPASPFSPVFLTISSLFNLLIFLDTFVIIVYY